MNVGEIIRTIIEKAEIAPREDTVDTLKNGSADLDVRGIAATFMATVDVVKRAHAAGANFIITHEPTYYNHLDIAEWHRDDPVVPQKRALIDRYGIAVWRFHDGIHAMKPDGITEGVVRRLGWQDCRAEPERPLLTIPETTVAALADHVRAKLDAPCVRVVGDPRMACTKIGLRDRHKINGST